MFSHCELVPPDTWLPPICALPLRSPATKRRQEESKPLLYHPWLLGGASWANLGGETWSLTVLTIPPWLWAPNYGYFALTSSLGGERGFPCTAGIQRKDALCAKALLRGDVATVYAEVSTALEMRST